MNKQPLPFARVSLLDGALSAFFKARLHGLGVIEAGQVDFFEESRVDWIKQAIAIVGEFKVVTRFIANPYTDCICVDTLIFLQDKIPIWMMSGVGSYAEEAVPFLDQVLTHNYRLGVFSGGRGPSTFEGDDANFIYQNTLEERSSFASFQGKEGIMSDGGTLGYHWYMGKALI